MSHHLFSCEKTSSSFGIWAFDRGGGGGFGGGVGGNDLHSERRVNAEKKCKSLDTLPPSKTKKDQEKLGLFAIFTYVLPLMAKKKHCQVGMGSNKAPLDK